MYTFRILLLFWLCGRPAGLHGQDLPKDSSPPGLSGSPLFETPTCLIPHKPDRAEHKHTHTHTHSRLGAERRRQAKTRNTKLNETANVKREPQTCAAHMDEQKERERKKKKKEKREKEREREREKKKQKTIKANPKKIGALTVPEGSGI